jgi:hypothetical protein
MVFKRGGKNKRSEILMLSGKKVQSEESYKYLGVHFTAQLK